MSTSRIQANFARKREIEHARQEQTSAVNRYFDHWGKVTSRFESWTTPEYYQNAEDNLKKDRKEKEKALMLEERRKKLRELYERENAMYVEELRDFDKRKLNKISTDALEKIDNNLKTMENEKRRLNLESKLYSRWRHDGGSLSSGKSSRATSAGSLASNRIDENLLWETKSDHETLAKLNWLDKQIENHIEREKEQKESEERQIRLLEEAKKREEFLKERQKIRESEIKELKNLQENHVEELRAREIESNVLRNEEQQLRQHADQLATELDILILRKEKLLRNSAFQNPPHNIKKIKMFIRRRSDVIREDLFSDIDVLKKIMRTTPFLQTNVTKMNVDEGNSSRSVGSPADATNIIVDDQFWNWNDEQIKYFVENFEMQLNLEMEKHGQIEAMYESEAKHNLIKWEEQWTKEAKVREQQILEFLKKRKIFFENKLHANLQQQKHLMDVKEAHLSAIENSNEKLKMLIREQEENISEISGELSECMEKKLSLTENTHDGSDGATGRERNRAVLSMGWEDSKNHSDDRQLSGAPKFGRKKIAWT